MGSMSVRGFGVMFKMLNRSVILHVFDELNEYRDYF